MVFTKDGNMIDIHAHILPGIDDGARDIYDTLEMAHIAAESGVTAIVATPHCNIPGYFDNYFGEAYKEVYQKAVTAIQKESIPIQLLPGMEVYGTYNLPELIVNKKIMPLNQSRYILIEFAFDEDPDFASDLLDRVREVGARPVVAHVERYEFVQEDPNLIYEWWKKGYAIQVNKGSLLGNFGRSAERTAHRLLRHGLVSVVASDAHGPHRRTPYLKEAYQEVCADYTSTLADRLFQKNPSQICKNEAIFMEEPIPFSEEWFR